MLATWTAPAPVGWQLRIDTDRGAVAWLLLIPVAVAVIGMQYGFRRTAQARSLAVAGVGARRGGLRVSAARTCLLRFRARPSFRCRFAPRNASLTEEMRYAYGLGRSAQAAMPSLSR